MKKIFITQRSLYDASRQETFDCLDSKFAEIFSNDFHLIPVPTHIKEPQKFAANLECEGIIFSGGNSVVEANINYSYPRLSCEKELLKFAINSNITVVGICYGMQLLNTYCDGQIRKLDGHTKTEHEMKVGNLCFSVNSYHDYGIEGDDLAKSFSVLGFCDDGSIEMIVHDSLPWIGIMWHPERVIHKQKLWIEMLKQIFLSKLKVNKKDLLEFLETNYESY